MSLPVSDLTCLHLHRCLLSPTAEVLQSGYKIFLILSCPALLKGSSCATPHRFGLSGSVYWQLHHIVNALYNKPPGLLFLRGSLDHIEDNGIIGTGFYAHVSLLTVFQLSSSSRMGQRDGPCALRITPARAAILNTCSNSTAVSINPIYISNMIAAQSMVTKCISASLWLGRRYGRLKPCMHKRAELEQKQMKHHPPFPLDKPQNMTIIMGRQASTP